VLRLGEFDRSRSMFGGGQIEEIRKVKIIFPIGTNLSEIDGSLSDSKLLVKNDPKSYLLQIVSNERFSQNLSKRLTKNYSFIKSVSAYPF
jgi:hypothetical protein